MALLCTPLHSDHGHHGSAEEHPAGIRLCAARQLLPRQVCTDIGVVEARVRNRLPLAMGRANCPDVAVAMITLKVNEKSMDGASSVLLVFCQGLSL